MEYRNRSRADNKAISGGIEAGFPEKQSLFQSLARSSALLFSRVGAGAGSRRTSLGGIGAVGPADRRERSQDRRDSNTQVTSLRIKAASTLKMLAPNEPPRKIISSAR